MKCQICNAEAKRSFAHKVLNKYDAEYYQCPTCGALFVKEPFWLEEAYSDAIASIDTGIMLRNMEMVEKADFLISTYYGKEHFFLDYGGGYGIFTRMMRDRGYQYLWYDKFAEPLLARGFEYCNQKITAVTAFELFEHFIEPIKEIEEIFKFSKEVIFSTVCYGTDLKLPDEEWSYFAYESGQHTVFYSEKTLKFIAKKYSLEYRNVLGLHWFTQKAPTNRELKALSKKYYRKHKKITYDYTYAVKDADWIKNQYKSN